MNVIREIEAAKSALDRKMAELMPQKDDPETRGKLLGLSFAVGAIQPAINSIKGGRPDV